MPQYWNSVICLIMPPKTKEEFIVATEFTIQDFDDCKKFLEVYLEDILKMDVNKSSYPINVLKKMKEDKGLNYAFLGMLEGIQDLILDSFQYDPSIIKDIDQYLISKNVRSLSYMRKKVSSKFKLIIKRGVIKNEQEYYLLRGFLDAPDIDFSEDEKLFLCSMISDYEKV